MLAYLFDFLFLLIAGGCGWLFARLEMVRAVRALMAFLIASLIALGLFEWVGGRLQSTYLTATESGLMHYMGFLALAILFGFSFGALIFLGKSLLPEPPEFDDKIEKPARWLIGVLAGYLVASFVLVSMHAFPAPRDFWGAFEPNAEDRTGPIMRMAPDYHYLGLVDLAIGRTFAVDADGWTFNSPIMTVQTYGRRWPTFVARYAVWRQRFEYRWFPEGSLE